VKPSGAARATSAPPIDPPAPVRFSTMKLVDRRSPMRGRMVRAAESAAPPGAKGTTTRIGRPGQGCASAGTAKGRAAAASAARRVIGMDGPPVGIGLLCGRRGAASSKPLPGGWVRRGDRATIRPMTIPPRYDDLPRPPDDPTGLPLSWGVWGAG
jgi:hypothetical protein